MIEDSKYGKITFVKDKFDYFISVDFKEPFGKYNPDIQIKNYKEEEQESYFRNLDFIYEKQDEIINNFYEEIKSYCNEGEYCDADGILGDHGLNININCQTKEIFYEPVG